MKAAECAWCGEIIERERFYGERAFCCQRHHNIYRAYKHWAPLVYAGARGGSEFLTALGPARPPGPGEKEWMTDVLCACGTVKRVAAKRFITGEVKTCGCLAKWTDPRVIPDDGCIDQVAVRRLVSGRDCRYTRSELREAVRTLSDYGYGGRAVAEVTGASELIIQQLRRELGYVVNGKGASKWDHGTLPAPAPRPKSRLRSGSQGGGGRA